MSKMKKKFVSSMPFPKFPLWEKLSSKQAIFDFDFEITARCNFNCRHCYINLPPGDREVKKQELTLGEIDKIVDQAVALGAVWCLITGGEPLLRPDFFDIYLNLKRKGLFLSVFTNAALITREHVRFFKQYPPRDIEVTVYGATRETFEQVTRKPGSFDAFMQGLDLLLEGGIKVRLKTMALRSNLHEHGEIKRFCRERTKEDFRFDPNLNLRHDGDPRRNKEIKAERLTPFEIAELEKSDTDRLRFLQEHCQDFIVPDFADITCSHLFHCGAGKKNFILGYNGNFRLCSSLCHPDCVYDLKKGSLVDAWKNFVPRVREMKSSRQEFLEKCHQCPIINLCMWCAANAHLETGELDVFVDYFCRVAHARAGAVKKT